MRVTGRKVTALEADVPSSVTQFDAATIQALGAQNIADLSKVTPNVEIRTAGATVSTFFIRGVGLQDFSANAASAVAIYGDDVSFNSPALQLQGLFDLENVEVNRGPQGWGSGRNASAGVIKLRSRQPSGELGGSVRASYGTYHSDKAKDALIQTYEGAVETPIIEGVLASRFAFRLRHAEPYIVNGCGDAPAFEDRTPFPPRTPGNRPSKADFDVCGDRDFGVGDVSFVPPDLSRRVGDENNWAGRGQFRFEPPESSSKWLLNIHGSQLDQQSTLGQAMGTANQQQLGSQTESGYIEPDQAAERIEIQQEQGLSPVLAREVLAPILAKRPLDREPYRGDYNRVGQTELDTWGGFVTGEVEVAGLNVRTVTGYDAYDRTRETDSDFTPDVLFETDFKDNAWQVSQEVTVSGDFDNKAFRWEVGGNYLQEELEADNEILVPVVTDFRLIEREYSQNLWSFGVWAGFQWDFLDDFTLELGGRYNWEKKRFEVEEFNPIGAGRCLEAESSETWKAPTGVVSLSYRFGETASVYTKYSRGFKAGHYNSNGAGPTSNPRCGEPGSPTSGDPPANEETIDSFETGLRGSWVEDRIRLRGAFFYYKYQDYQVFLFENNFGSPPTLEVVNANSAEVLGLEMDADIRPLQGWVPDLIDQLLFQVRFGWLETRYLDFTDQATRQRGLDEITTNLDFTGNQLINSPRFKVSGTAEWPLDMGYWGTITPRYDFTWTDDIYFNALEGRGEPDIDGVEKFPEFTIGQKAYVLHNLMLSYRTPEGNMEISGWVRNLFDERYKNFSFDASTFSQVVINFPGAPRTVGADLTIRW